MRSAPRVYEKCLILSVSLSELSPSVSLASAICSTHAALSPFQSQYLVIIAADCFQEGDHINTHTLSPPPSFDCLSLHPWGNSFAFICFFVSLQSLYCSACFYYSLPPSQSVSVYPEAGYEYLISSLSLLCDGLRE